MLNKFTKSFTQYIADTIDNLLWFLHIHKRDVKDLVRHLKARTPKYIKDTKLNLAWYCAVHTEQARFNLAQFSRGLEQKLQDPITLEFLNPVISKLNQLVDREIFLNTRCLENARVAFKPALAYQGIAVFTLTLAVLFSTASVFTPKPQLAQNTVINPVHSKSVQNVVAGRKVTWTVQIPKSEITKDKYLLQLPREARNIQIGGTSNVPQALTLHDRKQLARMYSLDLTGINLKNTQTAGLLEVKEFVFRFIHSITQYLAADLEHAADAAIAQIADKLNPKIKTIGEAKLLDLKSEARNPKSETNSNGQILNDKNETGSNDVAELEAESYTLEASDEEFIEVTYETDGPIIQEEETPTGKLVTVSSPDETKSEIRNPKSETNSNSQKSNNENTTGSGDVFGSNDTFTNSVSDFELRASDLPEYRDILAYTTIPEIYKVGQEAKIKIKWLNEDGEEMPFTAFDLNNNGKLDYIEWTVPHLSEQIFEIIFISKAWLLDQNLEIQEDIYEQVSQNEGTWAENTYSTVEQGQYVRITFEQVLNNSKDITIHMRPNPSTSPGLSAKIEVYPVYTDEQGNQTQGEKIAEFPAIESEGTYKIYLTNLQEPTDKFDLKVVTSY